LYRFFEIFFSQKNFIAPCGTPASLTFEKSGKYFLARKKIPEISFQMILVNKKIDFRSQYPAINRSVSGFSDVTSIAGSQGHLQPVSSEKPAI
jgi:hypothetical protein